MLIQQVKEHLTGQLHGGSLNKVRNFEAACERAANTLLTNLDPIETERTTPLARVIHDDLNNYPLPSDYKKIIDLYPQDDRTSLDSAGRVYLERFALRIPITNKKLAIEGSEGDKFLRVNWKSNPAAIFHSMNSLTENGTIAIVGTSSGLKLNKQIKYSGSASVEFDVATDGDGIQITEASALDLENEDELDDIIIPVYVGDITYLTGFTAYFGNDLTTNYWTGIAQTSQADGTAWRNGWNLVRVPWSTATESGTVDPSEIDSFKLTVQASGAISNIRVDNIIFSLGRAFDIKYYSKYLFKNTSGTFLARPTSDDDTVIGDGDLNNIFLYELLKICAHQIEGEDAAFDISFANKALWGDSLSSDPMGRIGLYAMYKNEFPSMSKRPVTSYGSGPKFRR